MYRNSQVPLRFGNPLPHQTIKDRGQVSNTSKSSITLVSPANDVESSTKGIGGLWWGRRAALALSG